MQMAYLTRTSRTARLKSYSKGAAKRSIVGGASAIIFFFSSRRRHTRFDCDWSSDVCSSDLNIHLITRHGDPDYVKLLDFGVAKLIGTELEKAHRTKLGAVIGTPYYMSPEDRKSVV